MLKRVKIKEDPEIIENENLQDDTDLESKTPLIK